LSRVPGSFMEHARRVVQGLSKRKAHLFCCACFVAIDEHLTEPVRMAVRNVYRRIERASVGVILPQVAPPTWTRFSRSTRDRECLDWALKQLVAHPPSYLTYVPEELACFLAWKDAIAVTPLSPLGTRHFNQDDVNVVHERAGEYYERVFAPVALDFISPAAGPVPAAVLAHGGRCVPRLARSLYDSQDFGDLPVLADALEEAGAAPAVSNHFRSGTHYRGCWLLDTLIGRR
jgi:hypothetical protein